MAGYATYDPTTSDPKKIASQNRNLIYGQGQQLTQQQQQGQANNEAQASDTQGYLDNLEAPLASGNGGYNSSEASQIELSPADKQNIVNGAGISAGVNTAASVGAAERAANAAGGNPAALMAYRARAAQQQGAQAGNAMTTARVGAQEAGSAGAQAVGNARLNQQTQGLGYYNGLQQQQNTNAQQDLGLQGQTYGTETSGLTGTGNTAETASQNPTTADKVIGAISNLADGSVPTGGTDAVVGEDGPEKVVDMGSHDYMANGGFSAPGNGELMDDDQTDGGTNIPTVPTTPTAGGGAPWWKKLISQTGSGGGAGQQQQQQGGVAPYAAAGKLGGKVLKAIFMADGGTPQGENGIFTKPTRVSLAPSEAVVPLTYRAGAKIRPSMAALPAARTRQPYGSEARG